MQKFVAIITASFVTVAAHAAPASEPGNAFMAMVRAVVDSIVRTV
ncbi:hypothetical protein [Chitinimonas koreensis]|nr:hypothetical protein [Chitinimonas koreensis]